MNIKKYVLSFLLVIATLFSSFAFAATNVDAKQSQQKLIYVIMPNISNPFFRTETRVATQRALELGYEVKTVFHCENTSKELDLFRQAISENASAIICDVADSFTSMKAIQEAYDKKIPTFLIDREIEIKGGLAESQILSNNFWGARSSAVEFSKAMENQGEYAELVGPESDMNAQIRSLAYNEVIGAHPLMNQVAQEVIENWDEEIAYVRTKQLLEKYPNLKGIICGNDVLAIGAVKAIRAAQKKIFVSALDGSNEARDAILNGEMVSTALQPCAQMARLAVDQADRYIKTGTSGQSEIQLIDCVTITKENAARLNNFELSAF